MDYETKATSPEIKSAFDDFLSAFEDDEVFDVAIASHVIEHMPDIRASLRKIRSHLRPGGSAIVEVPGLYTVGFKRCHWDFLRTLHPAHIVSMNRYALSRFFLEEGFEEVYGDEAARGVFRKTDGVRVPTRENQYARVMDFLSAAERKRRIYQPLLWTWQKGHQARSLARAALHVRNGTPSGVARES